MSISLLSDSIMTLSEVEEGCIREINIPMPARSMLLLREASRHELKHEIKERNITSRRLCVTIRNLSNSFVNDYPDISEEIMKIAKTKI